MGPTLSQKVPSQFLLCILLSLCSTLVQSESTSTSVLFQGTLPSNTTLPSFTLTPGDTKRLSIELTGIVDRLIITFTEDTYQIEMYKLTIKNNNLPETSQISTFDAPENLTVSLDTRKGLFVIQGDRRFRLSKIVRERLYDLQVQEEVVEPQSSTIIEELQSHLQENANVADKSYAYYILAGVIGGILGIIIVVKAILYLGKRRKTRKHKRSTKKKPSNAREVHPEIPSPTPIFMVEENSPELYGYGIKSSINLDEKVFSDHEIDVIQHVVPNKKEAFSSLTSLESGLGKTTNMTSSSNVSSGLIPSSGSIPSVARDLESSGRVRKNEVGSKKGMRLEAITEEPSVLKSTHAADSGRGARPQVKKRINDVPDSPSNNKAYYYRKHQPKAGIKLPKLTLEHKAKSTGNTSSVYQENRVKSSSNPTIGDIKRLVNRMALEKESAVDSPEVSESEGEEQDLRPEPVNFFCCMVCKAEKRSTVAEPCGHIFACDKCVKRIVNASKTCKLCSRRVKSYHSLKDN